LLAGYTWTDYKTNTQIAKELKITQFLENYWNKRETGFNI
jgi:ribosomal protein L16 Arg81 hydroxylase